MMTRAALICAALSVIAHVGGVVVTTDASDIEIAGAAPAQARLGNSFQDIASGSATAAPVPDAKGPVSVLHDAVLAPNPSVEETPPVVADTAASRPALEVSAQTRALPVAPTDPDTSLPQTALELVMPVVPTETITGDEPVAVTAATDDTVRPHPRPEEPQEEVPAPPPERVPARQPEAATAESEQASPPAASPGAAETERRGVAEGVEEGASDDNGTGNSTVAEAGNAAASNYPGAVMRKINRTRKPRVGAQGSAIVGFEIAANGGLSSVIILRSSGEAAIDQAALDHLRRAAPFAAPPPGAERRFQVEYVSRG